MSTHFKVALIQNSAIDDLQHNLRECDEFIQQAIAKKASLICLPEYFSCLEQNDQRYIESGYTEQDHPALTHYRQTAKQSQVWLLLGSLPILVAENKVNNRSYLIGPDGAIAASYNKIHLFDVALRKGEFYRESHTVEPGDTTTVADLPWGRLGLSICYDVRFPQLYRHLANLGADFISVPAAFTATTGEAHWHVLLRSRAIETGCFIFAPGQCGRRPWGRRTYGHSLVISPWGEVLADGGSEPGLVMAEIDPAAVSEARGMIPSLSHDRPFG